VRRAILVLGGLCLAASLPARVLARDPAYEVDGEAYEGRSNGGWTCGPRASARYGGVGGRVRVAQRPAIAEDGAGFYGTVGAAAEYELVTITRCPSGDCDEPPDHLMFGGGITGGYRGRWLGVSLGILAFQAWEDDQSSTPGWSSFPAFELSFGRERAFHWPLGFGAPIPSAYRRPAIVYTGPRYVAHDWRLEALVGIYRGGPAPLDVLHYRFDATIQFLVTYGVWMGPHAAIATEGTPVDPEIGLRLGMTL
jgi:hypothetical protein